MNSKLANSKLANKPKGFRNDHLRIIIFVIVALLHLIIIFLVVFEVEIDISLPEPIAGVMKLIDVEERIPERPPPEIPHTNTFETIAETMIETDEPPPEEVYLPIPTPEPAPIAPEPEVIEYLRQHLVSVLPVLPDDEIKRATIYPPIPQRSGLEGMVALDLFIDRYGVVQSVVVLREEPPGRGFAQAAVNAFRNIRGRPAEANGEAVAIRFRYNIHFTIK